LKKLISFFILLFIATLELSADEKRSYQFENSTYEYSTPKTFDFVTTAPGNYLNFLDSSFSAKSMKGWGTIIATSALLYAYDEEILKAVQNAGRQIGFGNKDKSRETVLINAPTDVPSALFFLGDGFTSIGIGAGFLTAGLIKEDPRMLQTTSQIFQGLLMSGFTSQALKRVTGREEPFRRTQKRGRWDPFIGSEQYEDNKTKYDSYPSAHMATAMTTFTIISKNYPEYSFVDPLGYSLLGLLGFQMVNSGVHWASDIPLSVGMGYMIGKTIVDNGRKIASDETQTTFLPFINSAGSVGASFKILY
jgi:hypothetical protein